MKNIMLNNYSLEGSKFVNKEKYDEKMNSHWRCSYKITVRKYRVCKSGHMNLWSKALKNTYEGVHF